MPLRTTVPRPVFVKALPLTTPLNVSVLAAPLTARLPAPSEALPESVSAFVPRKFASAESVRALASVRPAAEAFNVPPAKVNAPVPSAAPLPTVRRPSTRFTPPLKVLALAATRAPVPVLVRPKPVPEMTPPSVSEVVAPVP